MFLMHAGRALFPALAFRDTVANQPRDCDGTLARAPKGAGCRIVPLEAIGAARDIDEPREAPFYFNAL